MAEAVALRRAMMICQEHNFFNIVFEGDYSEVVNVASNHMLSDDILNSILYDIHYMLERAPNWKVIYTPKLANQAAHVLAKLACSLSHDVVG